MTKEEREKAIIELYESGLTLAEVGRKIGVSSSRAGQILRASGVLTRGRRYIPSFIICETCGAPFESRYTQKRFCTLACYNASPQFRAMLRENLTRSAERKRAASQNGDTTRRTIQCLNCDTEVYTKPSRKSTNRKGTTQYSHKYCSRKCYREYMAGRFDRFIASPESLALPQNYDEFLTGDVLHCLVEGCGWSGEFLSAHMNFTHGIAKDKFKEMAGFNVSTGIVTADLSQRMSDAKAGCGQGADFMTHLRSLKTKKYVPPRVSALPRLEGKEHARKSRMLREPIEVRFDCIGCGKATVVRGGPHYNQKYCTVECRDKHYRELSHEKYATPVAQLPCLVCGQRFGGNDLQTRRHEQGLPVVCGPVCRQRRAGAIARGVWPGDGMPNKYNGGKYD